jgi:hypothetical protein
VAATLIQSPSPNPSRHIVPGFVDGSGPPHPGERPMTLYTEPVVVSLWICVMLAQGYVLGLLLGRGFRRDYPAFTAFMAFCVLRSLVLFYVAHEAMDLYQIVLWGSYLPQLVLLIMLVVEGFQCLFSPIRTLPKGTLAHFVEASCACLGVVTVLTLRYPGERYIRWITCMWALDQATSWVMFTYFGLTGIMATYFGIPWRRNYGRMRICIFNYGNPL